jgi:small-conductance mechanosensitive channel
LELLQLSKAVTTLLAGAGIIGLALSFAFQDIASNFVSGLLIVTRRPFKINDIIESNNYFGKVIKINLRNTLIQTFQGQVVLIPNKKVFENAIINYTYNGERRIDLSVGISYADDLEKVKEVTSKTIEQLPETIKEKGVVFTFNEFGNSSINLMVRFWVKYNKNDKDYLPGLSNAIIKLKKAYDENDIMIPFPIRTLDFGVKGGLQFKDMLNGYDKIEESKKQSS